MFKQVNKILSKKKKPKKPDNLIHNCVYNNMKIIEHWF